MSHMPRLFKRSTSERCGLNQIKLQVTYKLKEIVIKGERNQLMIWGFTEFRTNKKMKI